MRLLAFIQRLKQAPLTLGSFFISFLSIVIVRSFFEFLFEKSHKIVLSDDFYLWFVDYAHVTLSWFTLFLCITLIINFFDRDKLENTLKISLFFFPIILIVPFLDLFVFGSGSILYEYDFSNFFFKFFNLFNPFVTNHQNITNGVRVEVLLVVLMSFTYIYLQTKRLFRSLCTAVLIYAVVFLFGYLPAIINTLTSSQDIMNLVDASVLQGRSLAHATFYMYIPLLVFISFFVLKKLLNSTSWYTIKDSFRIQRLTLYLGLFLFGVFVSLQRGLILEDVTNIYDIVKIFTAMLAISFAFGYATVLNNTYDLLVDTISNPNRPLVKKQISLQKYKLFGSIYLFFALFFAVAVTKEFVFILIVILALSYVYSAKPLRYKQYLFVPNILLAMIAVLVFFAGCQVVEGNKVFLFVDKTLVTLIFALFFVSSFLKDIKDIQGDRFDNITTLATMFDKKFTLRVIKVAIFIVLSLTLFFLKLSLFSAFMFLLAYSIFAMKIYDSEKLIISLQALMFLLCLYILL